VEDKPLYKFDPCTTGAFVNKCENCVPTAKLFRAMKTLTCLLFCPTKLEFAEKIDLRTDTGKQELNGMQFEMSFKKGI